MAVYLIEAIGVGLLKIGFSVDPAGRFESLAAVSPVKLLMLGHMVGGVPQERAIHERFRALRAHHEWFTDSPAIREHFASQESWQPCVLHGRRAGRVHSTPKRHRHQPVPESVPLSKRAMPAYDNRFYRSVADKYLSLSRPATIPTPATPCIGPRKGPRLLMK